MADKNMDKGKRRAPTNSPGQESRSGKLSTGDWGGKTRQLQPARPGNLEQSVRDDCRIFTMRRVFNKPVTLQVHCMARVIPEDQLPPALARHIQVTLLHRDTASQREALTGRLEAESPLNSSSHTILLLRGIAIARRQK